MHLVFVSDSPKYFTIFRVIHSMICGSHICVESVFPSISEVAQKDEC